MASFSNRYPEYENRDHPPGTITLVEFGHDAESGQLSGGGNIILVPEPADTANDPLNWSKRKILWHYFVHCLWLFLANASIAWSSPAWAEWTVSLDTTYTLLNYGQALLVVTCGVGVLVMQPMAIKYGRRLPYVLGSVLILAGLTIGCLMKDIRFWFAYQIIAGFGSAPAYSTIITSLLDVSFIHQRGSALGFFALVLISGNFLPPIAAGYIVDNQGWQWCFYYLLIFFGLSCLLLLFTAEETGFARATHKARSAINGIAILQNHDSSTKADRDVTKENTAGSAVIEPVASRAERSAYEDAEKLSYYQKMGLYRENPDIKTGYWRLTFSVFKMALLPAAIWMTILFSIASFVVGVILGTLSSFFAEPPYNFSPSAMGLMFLALLIGAVIGSCWGGPFTDWLLLRLARRNGGLYEPEHRLYAYTIVPFLGAGGILLYGIGADQGLHWTIPCLGLLLVGIYLDASTPIAMGYALDSYSGLEDEILQLANVLRNVLGGAFSFGLQPWINHSGRRNTTICIAVMVFTFNITSIGFQLWGKRIRSMMAPTYYKLNDSIHK